MSGKAGLGIGLLAGLVLAIGASVTTMMVISGELEKKQAAAYDRGFNDAMDTLKRDGEKIGDQLNALTVEENNRLHDDLNNTRTRLQGVMARDDLPQSAKDELADIVNNLAE